MFKCHLCELQTKQLNGLLSRHYKIHTHKTYSKESYKRDVLIANGRPPKICKFCNEETTIPKGEKDYPDVHKACYLNNIGGDANPNWIGGKVNYMCGHCKKHFEKHSSMVLVKSPFCSPSCAMQHYAHPDNRTEAQKECDIRSAETLKAVMKTEAFKKARVESLAKFQQGKKSKPESLFFDELKKVHLDAVDQHIIDFYTVDCFVPSTKEAFEVNGNYWHNQSTSRRTDSAKKSFIRNNYPDHTLHTIWESEINDLSPEKLVEHARKPVDVYILSGVSGSGKSYIADQLQNKFLVIDYDKIGIDDSIAICSQTYSKPKLLVTPFRARYIAKELRSKGVRVCVVFIIEDESVIKTRLALRNGAFTESIVARMHRLNSIKDRTCQYHGTQTQVYKYLQSI